MKLEELNAILVLAGIIPAGMQKIENQYWPNHPNYDDVRQKHPWWSVITEDGVLTIGWRKRVIHIDWVLSNRRGIVTEDDVTKDVVMVHAWSFSKAIEYLRAWKSLPVVDVTDPKNRVFDVVGREQVIEHLRLFGPGGWEQDLLKNMLDEVKVESEVTAHVRPAGEGEYGFTIKVGSMTVQHYPRGK